MQLAIRVEGASGNLFTAVMTVIPPHARDGVVSALEALDVAVREVLRTSREAIEPPTVPSKKAR